MLGDRNTALGAGFRRCRSLHICKTFHVDGQWIEGNNDRHCTKGQTHARVGIDHFRGKQCTSETYAFQKHFAITSVGRFGALGYLQVHTLRDSSCK